MGEHKPFYIILIIGAIVMFGVAVFFNGMAGGTGAQIGIFQNDTGGLSDKYSLEITPAGWTFSIWGFIYAYQALFLVYALTTICRRGPNKGYLYYDCPINPPTLYVVYIFNMACNIAWLFAFDLEQLIGSAILLAAIAFTLYICLIISMHAVVNRGPVLAEAGNRRELWIVRGIVHNALAMYATWTTIATLLNFCIVLVYRVGMSQENAGTTVLGVLSFEILLYALMDFVVVDRYTRYTFTPYIVVVVALTGSLLGNWYPNTRNFIFTAALLGVGGTLALIKLILSVWRHFRKPMSHERIAD